MPFKYIKENQHIQLYHSGVYRNLHCQDWFSFRHSYYTTPFLFQNSANWILLVLYSPTWATSFLNSTQNIVSVSKTQIIALQFDLRDFFPPLRKNNLILSRAAVWKQNLPPDYQKEHSIHSSFRSSFMWDPPHEHLTWLKTSSNGFLTTILFHQFNTGYELGHFQHHTLPLLHQWLCVSSVSFSFLQISVTSFTNRHNQRYPESQRFLRGTVTYFTIKGIHSKYPLNQFLKINFFYHV